MMTAVVIASKPISLRRPPTSAATCRSRSTPTGQANWQQTATNRCWHSAKLMKVARTRDIAADRLCSREYPEHEHRRYHRPKDADRLRWPPHQQWRHPGYNRASDELMMLEINGTCTKSRSAISSSRPRAQAHNFGIMEIYRRVADVSSRPIECRPPPDHFAWGCFRYFGRACRAGARKLAPWIHDLLAADDVLVDFERLIDDLAGAIRPGWRRGGGRARRAAARLAKQARHLLARRDK